MCERAMDTRLQLNLVGIPHVAISRIEYVLYEANGGNSELPVLYRRMVLLVERLVDLVLCEISSCKRDLEYWEALSTSSQLEINLLLWQNAIYRFGMDRIAGLFRNNNNPIPQVEADINNDKILKARELRRTMHANARKSILNRTNYVDFFCFLLFFMSIPNDEMARWVFWLWFYIPKIKPNQERLHNLCNDFYKKEDPNKAWYSNEVRTIVKVVDDNFNAFSFQMIDQRTGGAWALQFHEMRKTITRNLGGTLFWTRLSKAFHFTIAEPSKYLHRLKDLRIRGSAPSLSRKGDRGDARHKIRDFVRKYFTYDRMPKENDSEFQGGGCLSTICNMISVGCSQMFSLLKKSQEQIGPEIDFTMGMGEGGYVRPSSRGTLAKLKNKIAEKEGKFIDEDGSIISHRSKGSHDTHPDDVLEGFEDEEDEDELEEVIPLEYKYRVQLKLPARVLYNKAESIKGNSIDIMRKCDLEVIPEGEILDRLNIDFEALFADPDSMDNISETKDDHEHIPSGITIRSDDDDESILSMDSAIRD